MLQFMKYFQVFFIHLQNIKYTYFKKNTEFNEQPIKSASIAQVHVGVLRENNKKVAVKVQHKWLREQSNGDISLVELFINVAEKLFPGFKYKVTISLF